jgi:hypothetical protein
LPRLQEGPAPENGKLEDNVFSLSGDDVLKVSVAPSKMPAPAGDAK